MKKRYFLIIFSTVVLGFVFFVGAKVYGVGICRCYMGVNDNSEECFGEHVDVDFLATDMPTNIYNEFFEYHVPSFPMSCEGVYDDPVNMSNVWNYSFSEDTCRGFSNRIYERTEGSRYLFIQDPVTRKQFKVEYGNCFYVPEEEPEEDDCFFTIEVKGGYSNKKFYAYGSAYASSEVTLFDWENDLSPLVNWDLVTELEPYSEQEIVNAGMFFFGDVPGSSSDRSSQVFPLSTSICGTGVRLSGAVEKEFSGGDFFYQVILTVISDRGIWEQIQEDFPAGRIILSEGSVPVADEEEGDVVGCNCRIEIIGKENRPDTVHQCHLYDGRQTFLMNRNYTFDRFAREYLRSSNVIRALSSGSGLSACVPVDITVPPESEHILNFSSQESCRSFSAQYNLNIEQGFLPELPVGSAGYYTFKFSNCNPPPQEPTGEPQGPEIPTPDASILNQFPGVSVQTLAGRVIKFIVGIIGTVSLGMFVYAGLLWMFSGGNSEKSKKAMQIMVWSALGIVVILSSYAIVSFIFEAF